MFYYAISRRHIVICKSKADIKKKKFNNVFASDLYHKI